MTFLTQYNSGMPPMEAANAIELLIAIVLPFALSCVIPIVLYFVKASAIYTLSKNRGLSGSIISFIPIAGGFIAGNIADDINGKMGKKSGFRFGMLITSIISSLGWVLMFPMIANFLIESANNPPTEEILFALIFQSIGLILLVSASTLANTIVGFIVNYRIYSDYAPQNATVFTVLAIFIRITESFFLFSIRHKFSLSIQHANQPPQQQIFL